MVEIEIADELGQALFFLPLNKSLRGRVDFAALAVRDRGLYDLSLKYPGPIPGLVHGFDAETGKAWLRDPLHETSHAETRKKIEAAGYVLGPARDEFTAVDQATWAFWLANAVKSGAARIIAGELPAVVGTPRTEVIARPQNREHSSIDKLTGLVGDLLKLSPAQRNDLAANL